MTAAVLKEHCPRCGGNLILEDEGVVCLLCGRPPAEVPIYVQHQLATRQRKREPEPGGRRLTGITAADVASSGPTTTRSRKGRAAKDAASIARHRARRANI